MVTLISKPAELIAAEKAYNEAYIAMTRHACKETTDALDRAQHQLEAQQDIYRAASREMLAVAMKSQ